MRHAHNVKVECNTVEYTKTFLCSDLLYFLWHGINTRILVQRQECLIKLRVTNSFLITDMRWVTIKWQFRVMFQSTCLLTQLPITPRQRNLKTEVSTWKHQMCFVHTMSEELKKTRNNHKSFLIWVWKAPFRRTTSVDSKLDRRNKAAFQSSSGVAILWNRPRSVAYHSILTHLDRSRRGTNEE